MQRGWWAAPWVEADSSRSGGDWWGGATRWWAGDWGSGGQGAPSEGWWSRADADCESAYSGAPGDSEATDNDHPSEPGGGVSAPPAVAGAAGRNTMPPAAVAGGSNRLKNVPLNDREDVGNIGWFCGNWGKRASNQQVQHTIDKQIKNKTLSNHRLVRMPTGDGRAAKGRRRGARQRSRSCGTKAS